MEKDQTVSISSPKSIGLYDLITTIDTGNSETSTVSPLLVVDLSAIRLSTPEVQSTILMKQFAREGLKQGHNLIVLLDNPFVREEEGSYQVVIDVAEAFPHLEVLGPAQIEATKPEDNAVKVRQLEAGEGVYAVTLLPDIAQKKSFSNFSDYEARFRDDISYFCDLQIRLANLPGLSWEIGRVWTFSLRSALCRWTQVCDGGENNWADCRIATPSKTSSDRFLVFGLGEGGFEARQEVRLGILRLSSGKKDGTLPAVLLVRTGPKEETEETTTVETKVVLVETLEDLLTVDVFEARFWPEYPGQYEMHVLWKER